MAIDAKTAGKLPEAEDRTATVGFEKSSENTLHVRRGHCPLCMKPMGMRNVQGASIIKVYTAEGIDYWCKNCYEKGKETGICIRYRSMSKKERKAIRKMLKKEDKK